MFNLLCMDDKSGITILIEVAQSHRRINFTQDEINHVLPELMTELNRKGSVPPSISFLLYHFLLHVVKNKIKKRKNSINAWGQLK